MSGVAPAASLVDVTSEVHASEKPRFMRRLLKRPVAVACLVYLALIVAIALVAPLALPGVSKQQAGDILHVHQAPTWHHVLGTDSVGRDVLQRLLVGTRITMIAVVEAVVVAFAISVPLGVIAGYFGHAVDRTVGWLVDLTLSMPTIVIVLVVVSVFPNNTFAAMVTLGLLFAPSLTRIVRSAVLPVREELYVAAARVSGLSRIAIMGRHILPRIAGPIIVQLSLFAAFALLAQAGLSFLGLIAAPPAPSWGGMLQDGIQNIVQQPWLIWPPGIVIALTVLAFGLLGDVVRDVTTEGWQAPVRRTRRRRAAPSAVAAPASRDMLPDASADAVPADGPLADGLLALQGVCVDFPSPEGPIGVVRDVSFEIARGETVGIVGESGCGKTVTAMSLLGLLPAGGQVTAGRILFDGRDLAAMEEDELRSVRGKQIGLISQEPMGSLNPAFRVGWQLAHCLRVHHGLSRGEARERAVELLERVQLPDPAAVAQRYPWELSGGMAQRVAIARALSGDPKLLIADEPTTALDVTVQAEIIDLLREIQREQGMAILLVTHDWGVIADICERAVVMYAGEVVERAEINPIFHEPLHPYTSALLTSNPHNAPEAEFLPTIPGSVPKPGAWPRGCHFHPRCTYATAECRERAIALERPAPGRETRCIHWAKLAEAARAEAGA